MNFIQRMDGKKYAVHSPQRAAGWCKAVENAVEIPPGAAFLNSSREGRVRPKQRKVLLDTKRIFL